jgi:hypothetical protein
VAGCTGTQVCPREAVVREDTGADPGTDWPLCVDTTALQWKNVKLAQRGPLHLWRTLSCDRGPTPESGTHTCALPWGLLSGSSPKAVASSDSHKQLFRERTALLACFQLCDFFVPAEIDK